MVTLLLSSSDLARTRFAFSPLWECVAAFRAWQTRHPDRPQRHWKGFLDEARREDWSFLRSVALAPSGAIPDFLAPPPPRPFVRLADEIDGLRATSREVIVAELSAAYGGSLPAALAHLTRDVGPFVDGLARELNLFWQCTIAPTWPRLLECLEAELVYRSRVLAFEGPAAVLRDLHDTVSFTPRPSGGVLRIRTGDTVRRRAAGAGLLLVPSMFAWPDVFVVARPPWRPTLAYPARGIAELWETPATQRSRRNGLDTLIGAGRARVLRRLTRPRTTSDLAGVLRMSPATISQHVTRLWSAGFLHRARAGRRVFYALNDRGYEVLRIGEGVGP